MGIFDKLNDRLDDDQEGINLVDLAEMPSPWRRLMRMMLREIELPYEDILAWSLNQPDDVRMEKEELDSVLNELTAERWLIRMGENNFLYEVNLRRKAGSTLASGIWSALDKRIEEQRNQNQLDD